VGLTKAHILRHLSDWSDSNHCLLFLVSTLMLNVNEIK